MGGSGALAGKNVLIIGGGCFGLSTALALAEDETRPASITVLDRSSTPPAPDAASSDHNKIIRAAYGSPVYTDLALRAIEQWRSPFWRRHYRESGVVLMSSGVQDRGSFIESTFARQKQLFLQRRLSEPPVALRTSTSVAACLPDRHVQLPPGTSGYFISEAGWVAARQAMDALAARVAEYGVRFVQGTATAITSTTKPMVELDDGRTLAADLVVVASGSWTTKLLPGLSNLLIATGQILATIQLSAIEAIRYSRMPVLLSTDHGWYCFPPTDDNVFKCAIHGPGYIRPVGGISQPRTKHDVGDASDNIAVEDVDLLRSELKKYLPGLATKDFASTRLCWYNETPDIEFLVDWHPDLPNVMLATGGSGHAFKFLPLLGDLVVGRLRGTLAAEVAHSLSATRQRLPTLELRDNGYENARKIFDEARMAKPEDLRARNTQAAL